MQAINEAALNVADLSQTKNIYRLKNFGGWLVILFAAAFVVFIAGQIFEWGDLKRISVVSDGFQAAISIASFVLAWAVTRHPAIDAPTRRAWRVLTFAYFAYSCGHTLWFYYSTMLGIEPFPSLADIGFLGMYPLMLCALLTFPGAKSSNNERLKFVLDTAIVMLGGTTFVWHFIVQPTIAGIGEDWLTPVLNLSYTVGDMILLLGITTVLLRSVNPDSRIALLGIVAGILNMFVADLGFAYLTLQGTYYSGHWIDNFFISSMLCFMIASAYQYRRLSNQTDDSDDDDKNAFAVQTSRFSFLPYFAVGSGFALLVYETRTYWSEPLGYIVFAALGLTALVVIRQITAVKENIRLQTENIERESEMKFSSFVKDSFDAITVWDFEGGLLYRSPSFARILGYDDQDLADVKNFSLYHAEDLEAMREKFKLFKEKPDTVLFQEYRLRHKNGSYRTMEAVGKFFDDGHSLKGVVLNARDITERKAAEERLLAFNRKLQLSNRELQDFAFVASHDLQEPLRKVQAFGDRLKNNYAAELSEEGLDYLNRMHSASGRMQTLIRDLLDFSRVTTKAQPFVEVNLNKVATEVISDMEIKIEETGAKINFGNLPTIDADPTQMRQLLQNLIGNAIKFRRTDQTPVIEISAETGGDLPENFCRISVADNGIGFDEIFLEKIFTVFQRLHGRKEYEGSGIGLAVCRKIVERHNGTLTAKSSPNNGARFIFTLPIEQAEGEDIHETKF